MITTCTPFPITRSMLLLVLLTSRLFSAESNLEEIKIAAEKGDAHAQFLFGRACLNGEGLPKDPAKAYEWMKKAADQGDPEAQGGLGFFYANGIGGVPRNYKEAVVWFRKGADKGVAKAQFNFARMLLTGRGVDTNPQEGLQWIQRAADQGLPEALFALGDMMQFGTNGCAKDLPKAFALIQRAAEGGYDNAQNSAGVMLRDGQGVKVNQVAALEWFRKAAKQGHSRARSNLGHALLLGHGTKPDKVEGLAWLMVAQSEITATKTLEEVLPTVSKDIQAKARKRAAELKAADVPGSLLAGAFLGTGEAGENVSSPESSFDCALRQVANRGPLRIIAANQWTPD